MDFKNVYEDSRRAESYAQLEFPGTYYLAYRDIPVIIEKFAPLHEGCRLKALDFGCGTGRSTRFLKSLGFDTIGADISEDMLAVARRLDPKGEYILSTENQVGQVFLPVESIAILPDRNVRPTEFKNIDLITALFTFDNIPGVVHRTNLLKQLGGLLNDKGVILLVSSTPEIYVNEWLSFSTKDIPENKMAKGGDKVKIIMTDVEDRRPVEDIVWFDNDYRSLIIAAGLKLIETIKPLGKATEPYEWVNETHIAPWVIYVVGKQLK